MPPEETKTCPVCRRPFTNRRKWRTRGVWDRVVYCSERCRRTGRADEQPAK
ncbi:DUF2256 domain-containing protein [Mycolicibacterium arenosum]|uniref:DUF2256 domain-containing protein n=1 Tax=Mycolicibacterium arenosum TaxID=2952157 RepID=A0ABT1LZ20_9MYCO|nr:DUF2256 domain-containing protein [Mycolicibacterium sp. CAU 1645]MCP9272154.1 DUF2256 domain-containing protein [Mycolicibacterium sp. CAU 1645]